MAEREEADWIDLSFNIGVHGDAYVVDRRTHYAVVNAGRGGLSGDPKVIDLINKAKPEGQSLPDFIKEHASGKKP